MKNQISVLIIARPCHLRDSLRVLLTAIPQVGQVSQADDGPSALSMGAKHRPALVMLDSDLPNNELVTTLGRIKARWPQAHCIVLVDNVQEQQVAEAARADVVLVKGVLAARLFATVEELLSVGDTHQPGSG